MVLYNSVLLLLSLWWYRKHQIPPLQLYVNPLEILMCFQHPTSQPSERICKTLNGYVLAEMACWHLQNIYVKLMQVCWTCSQKTWYLYHVLLYKFIIFQYEQVKSMWCSVHRVPWLLLPVCPGEADHQRRPVDDNYEVTWIQSNCQRDHQILQQQWKGCVHVSIWRISLV